MTTYDFQKIRKLLITNQLFYQLIQGVTAYKRLNKSAILVISG
jgi:hypothetical protein